MVSRSVNIRLGISGPHSLEEAHESSLYSAA
jgi:hypothetical protein